MRQRSSHLYLYFTLAIIFMASLSLQAASQLGEPDEVEKQISQAMQSHAKGLDSQAQRQLANISRLLNARPNANRTATTIKELRYKLITGIIGRKQAQIELQSKDAQKANSTAIARGIKYLESAEKAFKEVATEGDEYAAIIENRIASDKALMKNESWRQAIAIVNRAEYNLAWIAYELCSKETDADKKKKRLKNAVESFTFITSRGYPDKPDAIRCEAIMGQAMVHYELGEFFAVIKLLKPATTSNTPPKIFKRMTWLLMKAYQAEPSNYKVEAAAKIHFDSLASNHQYDNIDLQMMLTRAKCLASLADAKINPTYYKTFQKRLDQLSVKFQKFDASWQKEFNAILNKSNSKTSLSQLSTAQEAFRKQNYLQAIDLAHQGLRLSQNSKSNSADLRYLLILSYWNLEKWNDARSYAYTFITLYPKDPRAQEIAKISYQAAVKNHQIENKPDAKQLLKEMDYIATHFGKADFVKDFPLQRADLYRKSKAFAQAIQAYQTIDSKNTNYARSRYGIALTAYQAFQNASDKKEQQQWLDTSIATCGAYISEIQRSKSNMDDSQHEAVLQLLILTGREALLSANDAQLKALHLLLARIETIESLAKLQTKARQALLLQIKARRSEPGELVDLFNALVKDAPIEDPYIAQSILKITEIFEAESAKAIKAGKNREASLWDKLLVKAYIHLFKHVDADDQPNKKERKMPIHKRLGHTFTRLKDYREAIKAYEWVLESMPKNQGGDVMLKLAKAYEKTGQIDKAIDLYKRLVKGLRKASDPWYEARYHWIKAEALRGDKKKARQLLDWFKLQHSKIASPKWHAAFDKLDQQLKQTE